MSFEPKQREPKAPSRHIVIRLTPDEYDRVKAIAEKKDVSLRSLARQAMLYALEGEDE